VLRVAAALPERRHVLNACSDRYRFTVAFAASLVAGKVSLLPSTHTPEVIRQLRQFAADVFCLTDDPRCQIELPRVRFPEAALVPEAVLGNAGADPEAAMGNAGMEQEAAFARAGDVGVGREDLWRPVEIEEERLAAYVFTSGSTGTPVPHPKTWGRLVACVRLEAERLGLLDGRSHAIVGTVPPQHMYGFESTVLLALQSGNALGAGRPFYTADVCSELESVPHPRMLVSTPVHLRSLLAADVRLPSADLVLSATAPLSENLAREVEQRFATRLLEIYGSTETGQIASRRTAKTLEWQLFSGVRLAASQEQTWAEGGHIEQPTPLCDVLEITGPDRFLTWSTSPASAARCPISTTSSMPFPAFSMGPSSSVRKMTPHQREWCVWPRSWSLLGSMPPRYWSNCAGGSTRSSCRGHCCSWSLCLAMRPANCHTKRYARWL
jgi:acyl-coenzyme A synthetase/AMP-(fatty) acid ligase